MRDLMGTYAFGSLYQQKPVPTEGGLFKRAWFTNNIVPVAPPNQTGQPIVLTINGKPAAVIQDVKSYERMAEAADYELTIRALNQALEDFEDRQNWPAHDRVFAELRKKNKIK